MKKLILISALLFSFNGWAQTIGIGITQMPCEVFLKTVANADENTKLILATEIHDVLVGVNVGTKINRFEENVRSFTLKDLWADNLDLKLATIVNSCEKDKDKKLIWHLMDYWATLPILDSEETNSF